MDALRAFEVEEEKKVAHEFPRINTNRKKVEVKVEVEESGARSAFISVAEGRLHSTLNT